MTLKDYQSLCQYIPYFESGEGTSLFRFEGEGEREEAPFTFSRPVYDHRLLEFIEAVYDSGLIDVPYFSILNRYLSSGFSSPSDVLEEASLELLRAVLAYYIRQERCEEGMWMTALREGVFLKALKRLKVLLSEKDNGRPRGLRA